MALGTNILLSGAMAQVWGMINGLQLVVNFPLFDIEIPTYSEIVIEEMISIATFEVLPSEDILGSILPVPVD